MSPQNRFKGEFPLGGAARSAWGSNVCPQNRFEGEFPLGGAARSAWGAA